MEERQDVLAGEEDGALDGVSVRKRGAFPAPREDGDTGALLSSFILIVVGCAEAHLFLRI